MTENKTCDGNVVHMLRRRQLGGSGNMYRRDLKILRKLILKGDTEYRKVWEKTSSCHISCESSRIYFENYKSCYAGAGFGGVPRLLYKLPNCPASTKSVDALICSSCTETMPLPDQGHKRSLLTITANGWLYRSHLETAQVFQTVYLSQKHKFREMAWVNEECQFYIRSTQSPTLPVHRQAGVSVNVARTLAVFDVFPLQFVCMLEIDKRIFGGDVTDAMLCQSLLIIMHQSGHVRMYSFEYILNKFRTMNVGLGEIVPDFDDVCGQFPCGLPVNVKITEQPPILFEVRCSEHNVQIGGFPWHYLITPYGSHGWFEVLSVDGNKLAENGELDVSNWSIEPDRAVFHSDESSRVLHISHSLIRIFQLKQTNCTDLSTSLKELFTVHLDHKIEKKETQKYTSSGRSVKKRVSVDEIADSCPMVIHDVDYEDELDLLSISSVSHNPDGLAGYVGFYDNLTGKLLREITLEEPYQEYYEHRVFVDKDTIIQRLKVTPRKFVCIVYKLFGKTST